MKGRKWLLCTSTSLNTKADEDLRELRVALHLVRKTDDVTAQLKASEYYNKYSPKSTSLI